MYKKEDRHNKRWEQKVLFLATRCMAAYIIKVVCHHEVDIETLLRYRVIILFGCLAYLGMSYVMYIIQEGPYDVVE